MPFTRNICTRQIRRDRKPIGSQQATGGRESEPWLTGWAQGVSLGWWQSSGAGRRWPHSTVDVLKATGLRTATSWVVCSGSVTSIKQNYMRKMASLRQGLHLLNRSVFLNYGIIESISWCSETCWKYRGMAYFGTDIIDLKLRQFKLVFSEDETSSVCWLQSVQGINTLMFVVKDHTTDGPGFSSRSLT